MEYAIVAIIVTAAALYLARSMRRSLRGNCGGCGPKPKAQETLIPSEAVTVRRRP